MGKLFVVGIGPGDPDGMTIAARRALEAADIVVGYTKYVELALAAVPDAAHLATPMMHEVERCRLGLSRVIMLTGDNERTAAEKPWRSCAAVTRACTAWRAPCWSLRRTTPM